MDSFVNSVKVYVNPNGVWDYFTENKNSLREKTVIIACNEDTGNEICLTCESNFPTVEVFVDNTMCEKYQGINALDIRSETTRLYAEYLLAPKRTEKKKKLSTEEQINRKINERDEELLNAFREFLSVVWIDRPEFFFDGIEESEIQEILDETLDNIGYDHGISIYRPCYMEGDDGEEFFTPYPYDEEV